MPILRVRRIGNSLGVVLPSDLARRAGLRTNDPVRIEIHPALRLDDVVGRLAKYRRSVREWNDATNEAERL